MRNGEELRKDDMWSAGAWASVVWNYIEFSDF